MTLLVLVAALAFGGGDQYLGSVSTHPWLIDVSLMSAPWLAVPFVAGWTQASARRGAIVGLAATYAALAGYAAMTLSPVENAHFSLAGLHGFVISDPPVFIGAFVTGPLFGWLGYRRSALGMLALAASALFEPFVHGAIRTPGVAAVEIACGVSLAVYVSAARAMRSCSTR